jgi:FtsH-binding integral membrane protein
MIQRIQSIWLFIAVLGAVFLYITSTDLDAELKAPIMLISCGALVILGGLSLFGYKNRKRQIVLNRFSIILNALLLGLLSYWLLKLSGGINFPEKGIEPVFPVISIIALYLANMYIRKDERIVKSVDRLR